MARHLCNQQQQLDTVNVLKFQTLFSFVIKCWLSRLDGMHKMLVRIANREYPDQTASLEAV